MLVYDPKVMNLLQLARRTPPVATVAREWPALSLDDYLQSFLYNGNQYPFGFGQTSYNDNHETVDPGYAGYSHSVLKRNGIVWACSQKRMQIFSEARYGFRRIRSGIVGEMFGTEALAILEEPQPGRFTPQMNSRMIQDVDLMGNSYLVKRTVGVGSGQRIQLRRPRPDWTAILFGSEEQVDGDAPASELDLDPLALLYYPGGDRQQEPEMIPWNLVAHWAPVPDPDHAWLGMSWITPIVREIQSDNAATTHKNQYWKNAATPNLMIKLDIDDVIKFREWVDEFESGHKGSTNAYKTLFLGAGADPTVIGANMQQMDLKNITGISENRIVMAAGLTATLLGTTEGLSGSSLNAGNYNSSRRSTADTTLANLFRTACTSLQSVVDVPAGAHLWFYADDIPFLQEDKQDKAEIQKAQAAAIRQYVDGGFEPDSVVAAVNADDISLLVHSGNVSVQLQPAGLVEEEAD